jgi:A/G-specific adenine glycosylase
MEKLDEDPARVGALRARLLQWYERGRRDLPWRKNRDPYAIWVSEIMLQQTRAACVAERYQPFLTRFPTLVSLALAPEEEVLALWSGLGYYNRARMLHKAAKFVAENLGGNLPVRSGQLRLLPGIGDYTAAAVASIAHGERVAAVDGNVERVLCRLAGWEAGSRNGGGAELRRKIASLAGRLLDRSRPGDFNQAMMELGATVCLPRNPQCPACPFYADCKTRGEHQTPRRDPMVCELAAHALSVRTAQTSGKRRARAAREVLLEQRPKFFSVMPGLWELPRLRDVDVPPQNLRMTLRHAIMRVNYYVSIRTVFEDDVEELTIMDGTRRWVPLCETEGMALTGLTRKVLARAHLLPAAPIDAVAVAQGQIVP